MSRNALVSVGGLLLIVILAVIGLNPMVQQMVGLGGKQPNVSVSQTPIDATTLSGHPGLFYLDAGNLTGTLSPDRFSAYQDLEDEKKIGTDSTIITDQNLADKAVTGVATGLGLSSSAENGTVTVSLVPGVGLAFSNGKLATVLGTSIDLNSNETVSVLPVAKGGTGLSQAPGANEVLVGTGTGYTYGLLADGDGTKLINASGQFNYSVDSTVCRTSGNCAGAGGGITGSGTPNHLARFSSAGTLSDSTLYDTGSALGIGTTSPSALLDIHGPGTTLGTELLANGSFNGNANGWNLYDCGSYANGQATVNYTNACSTDDLSTTVSVEAGKTYQLSFDLVSAIDDQVYWYLDGASGYSNGYDSGSHVDTFTADASGIVTIHFEGWNWNYGSSWTIDDVSVQEVDQAPAFSVDGLAQVTGTLSVNGVLKTTGLAIGDGATTQSGSEARLIDLSQNLPDPSVAATSLSISQQNTNSDTGSYSGWLDGLDIYQTFNAGTVDRSNGIFLAPQLNGTATANKMDGLRLYVSNTSSGNATKMIGNEASIEHYGTGTITNAYGEDLAIRNFSTGKITNAIALNIERPTNAGGGTFTNNYGLYINDQSSIATGTNYNIYSAGNNSINYFAGGVGIGTIAPKNKLDVNGALAVGSYAGANAAPSNGLIVSGNVGIGTNNPGANLDVTSSASTTNVAQIIANSVTSGRALNISANGLTTGQALYVVGTSTSTTNEPTLAALTYTANPAASSTAGYDGLFVKTQTAAGSNGGLITNNLTGVAGYVQNNSTSGSVYVARGILGQVMSVAAGGTVSNAYALQASAPYITAGTITNSYGLYVSNQTGGTNNYGIYIAGATTASLWLGSDAANAASGITFGSAKDANLYRLASGSLKTDGLFTAGNGVVIGSGGTQIKKHISATTTWDPPSVATGAATSTTVTLTGAAVGDVVTVGFSQPVVGGMSITGAVTAANTVTVTLMNLTGSAQDLASGTLRVAVSQY